MFEGASAFDQKLGDWDVSTVSPFNMFQRSAMPCEGEEITDYYPSACTAENDCRNTDCGIEVMCNDQGLPPDMLLEPSVATKA